VLAIAGMGVAAYLTYSHYADQTIMCAGLSGCDAVENSEYSTLLDIPVGLVGTLFCAGLLALVLEEWAPLAAFSMTLAGVAFAAYLTYIELFVVEDICIWCTTFAGIVTVAWLITLVDVLAPITE
jgi:uncharacterized membrane protein